MRDAYNCEPRRRIRRSSSTKSAASIFSGLGVVLSLYAVDSVAPGARNDERLEGLPPPGGLDAAAEAAADASIDGANTSYAEALQINNNIRSAVS